MRCWRLAGILPALWNADLNNDFGSKSRPVGEQRINQGLHEEHCGDLSLKVKESGASKNLVFRDTFATSDNVNQDILSKVVDNWIDIEDTRKIVDCEINEEIQRTWRNEPEIDDDSEEEDGRVQASRLDHK